MKILITNNRDSLLSLELFVGKTVPNVRVSIPAKGYVDVGEIVTLSALNNSPELASLIASGSVSVTNDAESGDIPELITSTVMKMEQTDMVAYGGKSAINADPGNTSPDEAGVSGTFSGGVDSDWEVVVTKAGLYGTFEVTVFIRGTASVVTAAFVPVSATPVLLADGVSITFTDGGASSMILRDRWFIDNTATVVEATAVVEDPGNTSPDESTVSGTFSGAVNSDWEVVVTTPGAYGVFEVTVYVRGTAGVVKAAFVPVSATPVVLADGVSITFTDGGSSVMVLRDRWFIDNTAVVTTTTADGGNVGPDEAADSGLFSGAASTDWDVTVTTGGVYGTGEVTIYEAGTLNVVVAAYKPVSTVPVLIADGVSVTFTDGGASTFVLADFWVIANVVVAPTVVECTGNVSLDEAGVSGTFSGIVDSDWEVIVTTAGVYLTFEVTVYELGTGSVVKAAYAPTSGAPQLIADGVSLTFTDGGASSMTLNDRWLVSNTAAVTAATAVAECAGNTSLDEAGVSGVYTGVSGDDWEVVVTTAGTYGVFEVTVYDIGTGDVVKAAFVPVSTVPDLIADGVSIIFTDGGASTVVLNDRWFIYNYSGVSTVGIGIANKAGTVKTVKAGTVTIPAAGESIKVNILKNGVSILTGVITLDDSSVSRIVQDGALDITKKEVVGGDFFEALLMYTAGGAPTPMVSVVAQIEISPA